MENLASSPQAETTARIYSGIMASLERFSSRKLASIGAFIMAPVILGAPSCRLEDSHNTASGRGPAVVHTTPPADGQHPTGGTHCSGGTGLFHPGFDCGNSVAGSYSDSFAKAHYHVDYKGSRVTAGDIDFPVAEHVNVGGMCLILTQKNRDTPVDIRLEPSKC